MADYDYIKLGLIKRGGETRIAFSDFGFLHRTPEEGDVDGAGEELPAVGKGNHLIDFSIHLYSEENGVTDTPIAYMNFSINSNNSAFNNQTEMTANDLRTFLTAIYSYAGYEKISVNMKSKSLLGIQTAVWVAYFGNDPINNWDPANCGLKWHYYMNRKSGGTTWGTAEYTVSELTGTADARARVKDVIVGANSHRGMIRYFDDITAAVKHIPVSKAPTDFPRPYDRVSAGMALAQSNVGTDCLGNWTSIDGTKKLCELLVSHNGNGGGVWISSKQITDDRTDAIATTGTLLETHSYLVENNTKVQMTLNSWYNNTSTLVTGHEWTLSELGVPSDVSYSSDLDLFVLYADWCFCKKKGRLCIQYTPRVSYRKTKNDAWTHITNYSYFLNLLSEEQRTLGTGSGTTTSNNVLNMMQQAYGQTILPNNTSSKLYMRGVYSGYHSRPTFNTLWSSYFDYNIVGNGPQNGASFSWHKVNTSDITATGSKTITTSNGLRDYTSPTRITGYINSNSGGAAITLNKNELPISVSATQHIYGNFNCTYTFTASMSPSSGININCTTHTTGQYRPGDPTIDQWGDGTFIITSIEQYYSTSSSSSTGGSSGGSSGGGGGCVAADTEILTAIDGSFKEAKDIKTGDIILGKDTFGLSEYKVKSVYKANKLANLYHIIFNNNKLSVTDNHPILTTTGYKAINNKDLPKLKAGDIVITIKGIDIILNIIKEEKIVDTVYNFYTEADNFIANNIVVACEDNSFDYMYTTDEDGIQIKDVYVH